MNNIYLGGGGGYVVSETLPNTVHIPYSHVYFHVFRYACGDTSVFSMEIISGP